MGRAVIGYYVHHQGRGHLQRMLAIARHLDEPMTALSSLPAPDAARPWVALPMDNVATGFVDPTANGTLHWVPRHNIGLRRRMAIIADWIDANDPDLMVVDVSVEVAALCRLLGVPTVVVAMRGDRFDRAHRSAYDAADALLASWPAEFAAAAAASPEWDWRVANAPADDPDAMWDQLNWADVVVTHGGQNAVAE